MNNKIKYSLIGIVIIILAIYGILAYNSTYNAKVEDVSSVSIPDGFTFDTIKDGRTILKNNITTLYINEIKNPPSLQSLLSSFTSSISTNYTTKNYSKEYNHNVTLVSTTVNHGKKLISSNFWYTKNGKTYYVQLKGKNNKTAVETVINSTTINPIPFI